MFVGNIDKSISFDEVKNYFYSKFSSIISAKLIVNQQTGRSKGYAFIEFSSYKEFCEALNIKEPLIFGKQKLVLNSAKNRFNYDEDDKVNELSSSSNQLIEDRKSLDSLNSFNQNRPSSSTETGISSVRNSKESSNSIGNNYNFLGDKMKPNINYSNIDNDSNNLQLQIKDSLKKLSEQYYMNPNDNKSSLFNYYCTPFLYSNYNNKKDFYFPKQTKENIEDNNLNRNCPFEPCKDK